MLNEFASYTSNLDATKNDSTHKTRDRGYCPNGTDFGRPVGGSLQIPPQASSWNYPYLSNLYNYYNPNSYELGNIHQYDNQKCSSQYARNYGEHSSRFHSTSVLQCCDPRCQLIAKHTKYPYHPVNPKINQHANKRTKNYYSSLADLPKADASVTALAAPAGHAKYTPCVPYPTLRNDLNGKYGNQQSEFCSPFANTIKRGTDSTTFNEYYTDIGNPTYWNKPNTGLWNRNSTSYYPPPFEDKNTQKIDQGNFTNSSGRSILFNRLLDHHEHPYETGYAANYYYGAKSDLNPSINYSQPNLPCEPVVNNNRLPLQTNSYQPAPAYNVQYPSSEVAPQYCKENTPKRVPDTVHQETRILDKNLDVREFLSTWEDDVDDEKVVETTNESPVIVLDCSNLEGDVLAKVKEKLNGHAICNDDPGILKIVDVSNSESATVLSPHTSVIQENAAQSKEVVEKPSLESSHTNSDGYMMWYSTGKKKEEFSYDLVEMTERLVNTVGKLLSDPEKKVKPTSPTKELSLVQSRNSNYSKSQLQPHPVAVLPNSWIANPNTKKNAITPTTAANCFLENVPGSPVNVAFNNTSELNRSQPPLTEKNVPRTFNLQKSSNDLKFSVNYSTQQNDYNMGKVSDMHPKIKSTEFTQPYYEYHKVPTTIPCMNTNNYKSYAAYSSYYENTGCGYDQTKLSNHNNYNTGLKDTTMNYVDHIEKHPVNDTDITLVKADLEKSLNEISHNFKPNNSNNVEKNCQYFNSDSLNSSAFTSQNNVIPPPNERSKVNEAQIYNGVIQKTGICNSPVQTRDNTVFNDKDLLSMPSLSPPPKFSSATTQQVNSSMPVSQNKEHSVCGINLTLTDMYENEDSIFSTSQVTESNTYAPLCSGNRTPNDQSYQPLNLALSRNTKSEESNLKDHQKVHEDYDSSKIEDSKTNSKTDDGYYSVENAEADDISVNNLKKTNKSQISVAYHSCIVSHEQAKQVEISCNNDPYSKPIPKIVSSCPEERDLIIISNQSVIDNGCKPIINNPTSMTKSVESIDKILPEFVMSDKPNKSDPIQSISSIPVTFCEDAVVQNDEEDLHVAHPANEVDVKPDSSSCCDTPNLEKFTDTSLPYSVVESKNLENEMKSDKSESSENIESESIHSPSCDLEDTALNLEVRADTQRSPISCESIIKENENFINHTPKENCIWLQSVRNNGDRIIVNCPETALESNCNLNNLNHNEPSPSSISIDQEMNSNEKNNNSVLHEVKNEQLKRKLIDISISNTNLPMKKRKGQEYLCQNLESLELTITPPELIESTSESVDKSSYSAIVDPDLSEEIKQITDIPRKNKKKRKKDKSKNCIKHKKYSKLKRHSSLRDHIKNRRKSYSFNNNKTCNSLLTPENNKEDGTISPINDNDDMFNLPSVAPTPHFDLIQDFELQKEQFDQESSQNIRPTNYIDLRSDSCKPDFIDSSVDVLILKAPSPNCILQDDSFIGDKLSSRAPSPYCEFSYEGASPCSVAPSPNYDIIEGVLFDDTDSSRNNEDIKCKKERNLEPGTVHNGKDFRSKLNDFQASTKFTIKENDYESDYEIDRYYFKRKRNHVIKHKVKKSKDYLEYNHHQNPSKTCSSSKFSVSIFRHFDYAVDEERFTRSEDDEYEPRPNHIRHHFKPKPRLNYSKSKENGKYFKKYNIKPNQYDEKTPDSEYDRHFNEKKSKNINSPEYQPSSVNLSTQCDKIISKFEMIKSISSYPVSPEEKFETNESFRDNKTDDEESSIISKNNNNDGHLPDSDVDDTLSHIPTVDDINSPSSITESDAEDKEILDTMDTSKSNDKSALDKRDVGSPIDFIMSKEFNIIANQSFFKSNVESEKDDSSFCTKLHNYLNTNTSSSNNLHQLSDDCSAEKVISTSNINSHTNAIQKSSSPENTGFISSKQNCTHQLDFSNKKNTHSPIVNQSEINNTGEDSANLLEGTCRKDYLKNDINFDNPLIEDEKDNEPRHNFCKPNFIPDIQYPTVESNKLSSHSTNIDASVSNDLPNCPSEGEFTEPDNNHYNIENCENLTSQKNTKRLNLDDSKMDVTITANCNQLSSMHNVKSSETKLAVEPHSIETNCSFDKVECQINYKNDADIDSSNKVHDCSANSSESVDTSTFNVEKSTPSDDSSKIEDIEFSSGTECNIENDQSNERVQMIVDNNKCDNSPIKKLISNSTDTEYMLNGDRPPLDSADDQSIGCIATDEADSIDSENSAIHQSKDLKNLSSIKNISSQNESQFEEEVEILEDSLNLSSKPKNETTSCNISTIFIQEKEELVSSSSNKKNIDESDCELANNTSKEVTSDFVGTVEKDLSNKQSVISDPEEGIVGESSYVDDFTTDNHSSSSLLGVEVDENETNQLSDLDHCLHESVLDPFDDDLRNSSCIDNRRVVESCTSPFIRATNSDLSPCPQLTEDQCDYSDGTVDPNSSLSVTNCGELITDAEPSAELYENSSGSILFDVPTLRFLAIKALSRVTINNNLLEVRETPESTEIIIHSEEPCDSVELEDGDSGNLIMTDTFDDDTHVSPNFEAMQEMTFDYPVSPESTSRGYGEKNDEDLPCQCLIISSEESILCLRCSLNSSVVANQFQEMEETCRVSVNNLLADTPSSSDCIEGDCIEQSFIDQEIDCVSSPVVTSATLEASSCSVPENVYESTVAEKSQIKVQLPWDRIFNLGDESNDGDDGEPSAAGVSSRQRMLELGPAQIEVRIQSDERIGWWKTNKSSSSSSPVVKVKRLVLQRASTEVVDTAAAVEESSPVAAQDEPPSEEAVPEPKARVTRSSASGLEDGERKLNEILGLPKMVIRKTSCRQYKSFLRAHRILQPLVCLTKNKKLDELALKCSSGEPLHIRVEDIESAEQVTVELGKEVVEVDLENSEDGVRDKICEGGAEVQEDIVRTFEGSAEVLEDIAGKICEGSAEVQEDIVRTFEGSAEVLEDIAGKICEGSAEVQEDIVSRTFESTAEAHEEIASITCEDSAAVQEDIVSRTFESTAEAQEEIASVTCEDSAAVQEDIAGIDEQASHEKSVDSPAPCPVEEVELKAPSNTQTNEHGIENDLAQDMGSCEDRSAPKEVPIVETTVKDLPQYRPTSSHLSNTVKTQQHFSLKLERHHCMLCRLSYRSVQAYRLHLRSRFHRHLELMQRETIHALYRRFTGQVCPTLRPLSAKERKIMKWKPRDADVNHFYHQNLPLRAALQADDSARSTVLLSGGS